MWGLLRVCVACPTPRLNLRFELRPSWNDIHDTFSPGSHRIQHGLLIKFFSVLILVLYLPEDCHVFGRYRLAVIVYIIFGSRRDEVTGQWRRLHSEKLNDVYSSPNIVRVIKSKRMRWAGHVACMNEERGVYRVLVGKPEGRRPLGRPRCKWVDNIRTDLQEVGCGYMDWIGLAQDSDRWQTLVSAIMNLRVP